MKEYALWAGIASAVGAVGAAVLLVKGGASYPWELRSYGGQTEPELAHKKATRRMTQAGIAATVMTSALAVASAYMGYLS